jgi:hypothetical protein
VPETDYQHQRNASNEYTNDRRGRYLDEDNIDVARQPNRQRHGSTSDKPCIYLPLLAPALALVGIYALLLAWND